MWHIYPAPAVLSTAWALPDPPQSMKWRHCDSSGLIPQWTTSLAGEILAVCSGRALGSGGGASSEKGGYVAWGRRGGETEPWSHLLSSHKARGRPGRASVHAHEGRKQVWPQHVEVEKGRQPGPPGHREGVADQLKPTRAPSGL